MAAKEPIHSGHFMTSNPHEVKPDEDDEDFEVDVVDVDDSMTDIAQEKVQRQDKVCFVPKYKTILFINLKYIGTFEG
jgi:hypothetical protein